MKVLSVAIFLIVYGCVAGQDPKCREKFKNMYPMRKCCTIPDLVDSKVAQSVNAELHKKHESNHNLLGCMYPQEMMKKLGLESLDKEECKKYAQKTLKEPWSAILESAAEICIDKIPDYAPMYQKTMNVTKDVCDAQYMFFFDCTQVVLFAKCPAENWNKAEQCENSKSFVTECEKDTAMGDFIHM